MNTITNLIAYYVTGNANGRDSYTATVCKMMSITPETPISALSSRIPELAQAIAKCEGYGLPNDVGTHINNPGNILWAGQQYAVAYKSVNGYTYAKFNSEIDGYEALETLLKNMITNVFKVKGPSFMPQIESLNLKGTEGIFLEASTPEEYQALCLIFGKDPANPDKVVS